MYKTKSSPSNINVKSPIATITTPDFLSEGEREVGGLLAIAQHGDGIGYWHPR